MLSIRSHNPENYTREFGLKQIIFSLKPQAAAKQRMLTCKSRLLLWFISKREVGGLCHYLLGRTRLVRDAEKKPFKRVDCVTMRGHFIADVAEGSFCGIGLWNYCR